MMMKMVMMMMTKIMVKMVMMMMTKIMVKKVMTKTLCPVRHALYLVANFTEQNLKKGIRSQYGTFVNEEQTNGHVISTCSSYYYH